MLGGNLPVLARQTHGSKELTAGTHGIRGVVEFRFQLSISLRNLNQ